MPADHLGAALRDARARLGIGQADAAGLLGTSQSNISAYERGRLEPGALVGARIEAFTRLRDDSLFTSYQASTLASAAVQLRKDRREERSDTDMLRVVIQASDDFARFAEDEDRWLFLAEPSPTGSRNWDALLAGLAVHLCRTAGMDRTPLWTSARRYVLDSVWWVGRANATPLSRASSWQHAIPSLRARGVIMNRRVLESV